MNQTEHVKLNQWELTDPILMSDFNADNQKLDAALAGKLGKLEFLSNSVVQGPTSGIATAAPGRWSAFSIFGCFFTFDETAQTKNGEFELYDNDHKCALYRIQCVPHLVLFFPLRDGTRALSGLVIANGLTYFRKDVPLDSLSGLSTNFYPEGTKLTNLRYAKFVCR